MTNREKLKLAAARRKAITLAIEKYWDGQGFAPSIRDLCAMTGLSIVVLHFQLVHMRREGIVEWEDKQWRTLRVVHHA